MAASCVRVQVRVGSDRVGYGFGVGGLLRQSLAPVQQATCRTEGSRGSSFGWALAPPRRDPDEMVSISPS